MKNVHPTSDLLSLHHSAIIRAEMCNDAGEHEDARYWLRLAARYRTQLSAHKPAERAAALRQISYGTRFPTAPGYRPTMVDAA
jgi:hypothetical protein